MAATYVTIDKYLVRHYTRKSGEQEDEILTNITCYDNQMEVVGYIQFYLDGHVEQSELKTHIGGPDTIVLKYPIERIEEILGTLRYEKPVTIAVDPDNKTGWVASGSEPVGEQEGV